MIDSTILYTKEQIKSKPLDEIIKIVKQLEITCKKNQDNLNIQVENLQLIYNCLREIIGTSI